MRLATAITFLQYCGVFPVLYDESDFSSDKGLNIKISKKFLCCTVLQFILTGWRLQSVFHLMIVAPSHLLLSTIITYMYQISNIAALLLSLKNVKCICKCIQQGNMVLASSNIHRKLGTFCSLTFFNFCLQTGSATLAIIQLNNIYIMLGLQRTTFQRALLSLAIFDSIFVEVLINYCMLMVLKIVLVSYSQINHRLSALSDGKSEKYLTSEELEGLVKNHWKTGTLLVQLNRAFQFHVLMFSSTTFAKVTLLVYFVCVTDGIWDVKLGEHPKLYFALHLTVYSMTTLLLDFLILCVVSQQVNYKRHKTLVLLSRLLRKKSDDMMSKINLQIRVFMYQVRSRELGLTGCDLFHVNRPLFYGMVMQMIAYIIILIQFKLFQ